MKKFSTEYDEEYVRNLLKLIYPNKFASLSHISPKTSSPDLVDKNKSIGVEVTNGLCSTKFKESLLSKQQSKVESEILNFKKKFFGPNKLLHDKKDAYEKLSLDARRRVFFDEIPNMNQPVLWSFSISNFEQLRDAICFKLQKLNSSNSSYLNLNEIDLFVLGNGAPVLASEMDKVKKSVEEFYNCRNFKKSFNNIYIDFLSDFYVLNLFGDFKKEKIEIEVLEKAKQETDKQAL